MELFQEIPPFSPVTRQPDQIFPAARPLRPDALPGDNHASSPLGREDVFFAAIEMTRMPMIVTDPNRPDNPIVFANPAFQQMTGYPAEEVLGRNCRFMQGPDTDLDAIAQIRNAISSRTDISIELVNYRKDGSTFWNALFVSPVFGSDGSLLYYFGSQLDVSRRREAEDALRRTQRLEALGQLTGGVAHDFNNLLQVVVGSLEVLRPLVEESGNPRARRRHEGALEAARRGAELTRQLLAFARRQRLDGLPTDINACLQGLSELLARALGGLALRLDLAPGLPAARLDSGQFEAALVNLLLNASAAMPGRGEVVITSRHVPQPETPDGDAAPHGFVELAVSDTGIGIPSAILDRVTEPFFTTREVGQGSGLGLAQVYGFVRQSGGFLRIESTEGNGTTVRLRFPALAPEVAVQNQGGRDAPETDSEPRGQGERVLVVDDNAEVLDLAESLLIDLGYQVETATDGPSAMSLLNDPERQYDLLFSDVVMPGGINGITLASEARQRRPGLRVLLSTGYVDPRDEAASTGIRPHGFPVMQKPYRRAEVARRIRRALDGNGAKQG
ncbi:PAS domain-containing protein [Roseomonas frigidaquae]|uniref:histidine kinase n=1 Tax=Falsiroseomonas frigidaquae TaxID=487318 RepID=A0ABX1F937_9PROT|nr:histidine kinase famiy protein [Falsiroseomonas frigidaquae]NKE48736.1 PAS domain-containing protein [Falsiroseomonas frigidaquae]